jgi:hypothetical protein
MVELNYKEWIEFVKRVEEDLKNPVGPVPTPKLKEAMKMIHKEIEKKKLKQKPK